MIRRISQNQVEKVVVLYKDRLLRFGFELIEYIASLYNCEIEIIDNTEKSEQQELVEDLVQMITVFSCKLQGKRANKAKKLIRELIQEKVDGKSHKSNVNTKTNNVIKKEKLLLKRNHRLTNIRKNYLNQTTSEIVSRKPRFICIEDLNVSGMMKNRHLSKAVQNQGFFEFRKQLEYKCRDKGIQLIVADRFYPSSKLCSCCGNIKKDLKLSDRIYKCDCGNVIDRDFQASINLKAYGERFAS